MLCFGGPYGNLQATEALLREARRLAVPAENIICTGDVVAYCADPAATVALVRESGIHVLMGNCEEALGFDRDDCGCGFDEGSPCDILSREWFAFARRELDHAAKSWMAALPRRIRFTLDGKRFAVVHGAATDIGRFVFASMPARAKAEEFAALDAEAPTDAVVAGHCGLPFSETVGGRLWHNPGVVGMPANDGRPETWFSLLVPARGGIEARRLPLAYDWNAAQQGMAAVGVGAPYARALGDGLWPDQGVLPAPERAARGIPLESMRFFWAAAETRAA
ncbi:MAG: metallophosphoesterase family protein [Alphaproteobacteria bacterium]|nr:metallophosphoesterase family protein [Alphaproteobacteria bacterium]